MIYQLKKEVSSNHIIFIYLNHILFINIIFRKFNDRNGFSFVSLW